MHHRRNDGVVITGGTVEAGQIVAGKNSRAKGTFHGAIGNPGAQERQDVTDAIQQLIAELREHRDDISNYADVVDSAELLASELEKPAPNKLIANGMLSSIREGVSTVSGLVAAVASLGTAIRSLF
jgi:hypothetical protein